MSQFHSGFLSKCISSVVFSPSSECMFHSERWNPVFHTQFGAKSSDLFGTFSVRVVEVTSYEIDISYFRS